MDHICLTIPLLAGQGDAARSFMAELESTQRGAYAESEKRIGIEKERGSSATSESNSCSSRTWRPRSSRQR